MLDFKHPPPLALYVHIPWCIKKCPYCDFNSHVSAAALPEQQYIDALLHDLEQELPAVWGRSIHSIFIGGGTPSLFQARSIDRLLSGLRARLALAPTIEITLEANPGAAEQRQFNELRACGINRLSIGVQSFQPQLLKNLGRVHSATDASRAVQAAQNAGFDNINIDLIYGIAGQTLQQAEDDITTALQLQPQHISHYQLTIEPDTAFYRRPPKLPYSETISDMQQHCQAILADSGYKHYEVSAYAQPNRQCAHNLNYWLFGDYLGIGAGAHQKLTLLQQQNVQRRWKWRMPKRYLSIENQATYSEGQQTIAADELPFEFMLNALRLVDGFKSELFYARTGLPITAVSAALQQAQERGLIEWTPTSIKPTALGQRFLNDLLLLFMR